MTRPQSDLLRDVAKALAGYGSLKHVQSKFPQHPGIQVALLEEVAYIEALEREVRDAAKAQVAAEATEITWDVAVDRLMQGGNLVLTARGGDMSTLSAIVATVSERLDMGDLEGHDETEDWGVWFRAARAQAQAGAGEGQGEGEALD